MSALHVVFGAGQIGGRIASLALAAGHRVRVVSRNPKAPPGAETVAADARDRAAAAAAAEGADVVYDCANPLYHHWPRDLVALGAGTLHAAVSARARLVALDCVYMYGRPTGPMNEESPIRPCARKGVLRAELAELRLAALRRGEAEVTIVRGSDFFGPNLPASWWGERFFTRVMSGKPGECLGDPDTPHSYTYADDVAQAMFALAAAPDANGVWHAPTVTAETTRQLIARIGRALDRPATSERMSPLLLKALGLFMPFMRELPEMRYQWECPFVLDDGKIRSKLGLRPTPIERQVEQTVAWARSRYGAQRSAA